MRCPRDQTREPPCKAAARILSRGRIRGFADAYILTAVRLARYNLRDVRRSSVGRREGQSRIQHHVVIDVEDPRCWIKLSQDYCCAFYEQSPRFLAKVDR